MCERREKETIEKIPDTPDTSAEHLSNQCRALVPVRQLPRAETVRRQPVSDAAAGSPLLRREAAPIRRAELVNELLRAAVEYMRQRFEEEKR